VGSAPRGNDAFDDDVWRGAADAPHRYAGGGALSCLGFASKGPQAPRLMRRVKECAVLSALEQRGDSPGTSLWTS